MRILVTGSAGHLGEALIRRLQTSEHEAIGLDIKSSAYTHRRGSITDRNFVKDCLVGADVVLHCATLHKPHIASHARQAFVDVNVSGTLNLLEEATAAGVGSFVFTSTTSVYGHALSPPAGSRPHGSPSRRCPCQNIYGITKLVGENLCELFARDRGLPSIVLRTGRFFPEQDDDETARLRYDSTNLKVNEFLYRRADIADVAHAHLLAMEQAPKIRFRKFIISATTPFECADLAELRRDAAAVVRRYVPAYEAEYRRLKWLMLPSIDRVYVNELARSELGWTPLYNFHSIIEGLKQSSESRSPLAIAVGSKGYQV